MFDFKNVQASHKLNRDFVLSKISDSMIFGYYFGPFKLDQIYSSKFRKDNNPSTGFYVSTSGKIIYNDLRTAEKLDAFAFVQKLYKCSFAEAVKKVATDFGLITGQRSAAADKVMIDMQNFDKSYKQQTKIHFVADKWTKENLSYWEEYHTTKDELKREGIYPIKKLYINEQFIPNKNNVLRYALTVEHKSETLVKVYSPGDDTLKWVSNIPLDIPFGFTDLPFEGENSFCAKAQKDRLVILKFLPDVIAAQNESISAISPQTASSLQFNYLRNFVGWDNDETGLDAMEQMKDRGFIPVHVPIEWNEKGIKDFSDLAKIKGLGAVEKLLKQNGVI